MKKHFTAPVLRVEAALAALTLQTGSGPGFTPVPTFTTQPLSTSSTDAPAPTSRGKN